MRTLKTACALLVLTVLLSLPVRAGNMITGIVDPPPPPGQAATLATGETPETDAVTSALSFLLQNLAALL